jgi:hypothetical protein
MIVLQSVDQEICVRRPITISEFLCEVQQISCTVPYEIITVRLGFMGEHTELLPS